MTTHSAQRCPRPHFHHTNSSGVECPPSHLVNSGCSTLALRGFLMGRPALADGIPESIIHRLPRTIGRLQQLCLQLWGLILDGVTPHSQTLEKLQKAILRQFKNGGFDLGDRAHGQRICFQIAGCKHRLKPPLAPVSSKVDSHLFCFIRLHHGLLPRQDPQPG